MVEMKQPLSWTTVGASNIRLSCVSIGGLRRGSKEPKQELPRKSKPRKRKNRRYVSLIMFEDFKEKIRGHSQNGQKPLSASLSAEVLERLKKEGIDLDNFTLKQLWPEVLDQDGTDISLMSGAETEEMVTYGTLRKYLIEKYPQSQQEAQAKGQAWDGEPDEPYQINTAKAREDPKDKLFWQAVLKMAAIFDKVRVLQTQALEYEKICIRMYWHLSYNWNHAPNVEIFRGSFENRNGDIFEMVEAYFKICRKYHVPIFEKPYYFLPDERKRDIKLEGDMLKRTGSYNENEIRISILEGIP
jgi:hypothetical protein